MPLARLQRLAVLLLILVGVLATTSACRGRQTTPDGFRSPFQRGGDDALREASLEELHALLAYRTPEHPLTWVRGRVSLREPDQRGTAWFDGLLIYREPDAVRLRGSRVGIGTLFEVIVADEQAWVHLRRERELFGGSLDELREEGGILGALSLSDMMAAILVNHDLRQRLDEEREWRLLEDGREFILSTEIERGRRIYYRIRLSDGLVRELAVRDPMGRMEAHVTYEGFDMHEGALLPTAMTIDLMGGALEVRFTAHEYKLHPEIDPRHVTYLPNLTVQPLRALSSRESVIPVDEEEPPPTS